MSTTETPLSTLPISSCPSRQLLVEYFSGMTDDFVNSNIESHVAQCEECERVLQELEHESVPTLSSLLQTRLQSDQENAIVGQAIDSAKLEAANLAINNPPTVVGQYRLIEAIGRGGMGRVFRAEHLKLHKTVALKLQPVHFADAQSVERFDREVTATGKLHHPAIVTATDAGVDAGVQYLAMEFIDGWDLGRLIQMIPNMHVADVCEVGRQVALGLAHAHNQGMVHRDIKPSNIMLDRSGNVKLLDFGLVLVDRWDGSSTELTTVGQFLGTLDYMAPEQAERSASVDHRSDLYSLGATLFRMLTGQLPLAMLPNQSPIEKLRVLTSHSPIRIRTLRPDLPCNLADAIDELLATQPEKRLASAAHVAQRLEPHCLGADLGRLAEVAVTCESRRDPAPFTALYENGPIRKTLTSTKHRTLWPLWIAAAALPFAIFLGVRILLESDQGNLVIESEVDDVKVRVLSASESIAREMTVERGNTWTKLRSGSYEITFETASSDIAVNPSKVVLKRGETIIARVSRESKVTEGTKEAQKLSSIPFATDPSIQSSKIEFAGIELPRSLETYEYKGQTLLEALRVLERERYFVTWLTALQNVEASLDAQYKDQIRSTVQSIAKRNEFTDTQSLIKLRAWYSPTELDAEFARNLKSTTNSTAFIKEVDKILGARGQKDFSNFDWTVINATWREIENRLSEKTRDNRLEESWLLERLRQSTTIQNDPKLTLHLLENYPLVAFGLLPWDVLSDNRHEALVWECRRHILNSSSTDLARLLILLSNYRGTVSNSKEAPAYMKDLRSRLAAELKKWVADGTARGPFGNGPVYSLDLMRNDGIEIPYARIDQMNMGGGRKDGKVILPLAVVLLRECAMMPREFRPVAELQALSDRLQPLTLGGSELAKKLFNAEWLNIKWTHDGRLSRSDRSDLTPEIADEHQGVLIAYALRRWAMVVANGDDLHPNRMASLFVDMIRKPELFPSLGREWIVERGREYWGQSKIDELNGMMDNPRKVPEGAWQLHIHQPGVFVGDTARLTMRAENQGVAILMDFAFEMENGSWKISKLVVPAHGKQNALIDN
ncbi:MAG: serine/threonine-protein kinase [Pirellula sp.]